MKLIKRHLIELVSTLMLITGFLITACGASPANSAADKGTSEYVGEISGTELYIAIAIEPSGDVLAYVCDGMGIDFLFRGTLQADNTIEVNSESGSASLQAKQDGEGFSGTFSANGETLPFNTVPVSDYGGLYRLTGISETEAAGPSQSGSFLRMTLLPDATGMHVELNTSDGKTLTEDRLFTKEHDHSKPVEYREHWIILLNDGRGHGGRIKSSFESGLKSIDPICLP